MTPPGTPSYMPILVIGIVAIILVFRLRRMGASRPLRLELLWVTPALLLVVTVVAMVPAPPQGLQWAWIAVALAAGSALGWQRGRLMHIEVDPETHALNAKASQAALYLIVAVVALRLGLRYVATDVAASWKISPYLISDIFLVFALGLLGVQRLEMALRARRLLAEARASKAQPLVSTESG